MWEGLFRIACLLKNKPCEEPVYTKICQAMQDTEDGSVNGSISEQIQTVRAALAVFEYNTDRSILKRIALWLRFLEIQFDRLSLQGSFLYQPADLMELFVRYYQITGMKSVLRLCAKLRASAFDWTTALHTFQQSIPIQAGDNQTVQYASIPEKMDYIEREKLINHAESLADGIRFTLYAGLFSGNGHDLSSGKTAWNYLYRHHHALCGGTSAGPFLCGCAPDRKVNNRAIAAWTEAFASQLTLKDSDWALEELIRIVFNGLEDCISHQTVSEYQQINSLNNKHSEIKEPEQLYARITRAVAAAYQHSVALTSDGIRIHYLIPSKMMLMIKKQPAVLTIDECSAIFQCTESFICEVDFFCPYTATADVSMIREGKQIRRSAKEPIQGKSIFYRAEGQWQNHDGFILQKNRMIICEDTHHQGMCFLAGNRLYSLPAGDEHYAYAVCETPEYRDDKITVRTQHTEKWHMKDHEPGDIPVLPDTKGESVQMELAPYALTQKRITMFPRTKQACSK